MVKRDARYFDGRCCSRLNRYGAGGRFAAVGRFAGDGGGAGGYTLDRPRGIDRSDGGGAACPRHRFVRSRGGGDGSRQCAGLSHFQRQRGRSDRNTRDSNRGRSKFYVFRFIPGAAAVFVFHFNVDIIPIVRRRDKASAEACYRIRGFVRKRSLQICRHKLGDEELSLFAIHLVYQIFLWCFNVGSLLPVDGKAIAGDIADGQLSAVARRGGAVDLKAFPDRGRLIRCLFAFGNL